MEKLKIIFIRIEIFVEAFEKNAFVRLAVGGIFLLTAWALIVDLQDRKSEAIARAWQLLTTQAPGNSGKVEALEYIAAQGKSLVGVDLSCRTMNGEDADGVCIRPTWLRGLDFSGEPIILRHANLSGTDMSDANLANAVFWQTNFSFAIFDSAYLKNTDFSRANLTQATLIGATLIGTVLIDADLGGAILYNANFENANLTGLNIGSADFSNMENGGSPARNITQAQLDAAWAWSDQPPLGLDQLDPALEMKHLCPISLRIVYQIEGQRFGVPGGC